MLQASQLLPTKTHISHMYMCIQLHTYAYLVHTYATRFGLSVYILRACSTSNSFEHEQGASHVPV